MADPNERVGYDSTIEGLVARTGEVVASPAANTVLSRLKAIVTTISGSGGAAVPVVISYTNKAISASAATANQELIATPGANKQIWIMGINFTAGTGDGSVSFQDEDDVAISGVMPFAQNGGMVVTPSGNFAMPLWKLATNKAFEVDTLTCDIKGSIQYAIIDVS